LRREALSFSKQEGFRRNSKPTLMALEYILPLGLREAMPVKNIL